ncbi:hypothetical protein D3C81_1482940 [compost metagenome]
MTNVQQVVRMCLYLRNFSQSDSTFRSEALKLAICEHNSIRPCEISCFTNIAFYTCHVGFALINRLLNVSDNDFIVGKEGGQHQIGYIKIGYGTSLADTMIECPG